MNNAEHDFVVPPFPSFPSVGRYVELGPVSEAITRIARSVMAREAISLIIGPPGTGKSLACSVLARNLSETHDIVQLGETSLGDSSALYRTLLYRLGVAIGDGRGTDLELMLHEHLTGSKRHVALIVDEAAALSSEVLEDIRRVTNIMRAGQPVISAIVVGGPKLDETLALPSMDSFVQRVSARCYLHALTSEETGQYIMGAIAACEASPEDTISKDAISAVYHASGGVPRLINQLMTEAIDCAAELNQSVISEKTVNQAWARLQQLPSPIVDEPVMNSTSVEFGELTDNLAIAETSPASHFDSALELAPLDHAIEVASAGSDEPACEEAPEPAAVIPVQPAADPVALFGAFDDEECLDIGMANNSQNASPPSDVEVESMLHCEIIGLSQFAADNTADREPSSSGAADSFSMNDGFVPVDVQKPSAAETPSAAEIESLDLDDAQAAKSTPSVVWYDEPEMEADSPADDSDLLWITEDVELERREPSLNRRVDSPESGDPPRLNIDYREMLEKMRRHG
ncbi:AAA family ATPase [Stieleria sp. JC731]|uniref:ExeA family protein n=1 Tax=Pirellulaceae TaxID=2691357 RepID=UPI001E31255D|nr:AAA family ATPase [Stieleria sp. JC731]MCC9601523.1 AAA family ATPase [Stieleria sp. JC731]